MADGADGSIRIDTELDNSGFEQGSDKLLSALKGLQNSIDAISDTLSAGFDSVIKSLQALSSNATTAYQTVQSGAQQAAAANQEMAQETQSAAQSAQQAAQQATAANQQTAQAVQEAQQATQGIAGGVTQRISAEYNSISRSAASLQNQLQRLSTTAEIGFSNDGQILRFRDSVDVVSQKVAELRERLDRLGTTQIPTEDYKFLQSEVEKTDRQLQRLLDRQQRLDDTGANHSSQAYRRLQYDIDNARQALETMHEEMSSMETNGEAFISGADTAEYQNMAGVLESLEAELGSVQAASAAAMQELSDVGAQHPLLSALATAAKGAGNAMLTFSKAIAQSGVKMFQFTVQSLGTALQKVASGAKNAVSKLFSFNKAAKAGSSTVKKLTKTLTSFKTMLISRIKRTFMSSVFSELQESFQKFASYSAQFDQAMSNIKNTGSQLSTNMSTFAANLITLIEPVVTRILSLINSVVTAINALFALLSGKKTVSVAEKQTGSYADSLNDAAGSAGKAASAQKKFNAELYGWDELTRQNKQDDSGSGDGTGPSWTEVPVDDILDAWKDKDWFQVGYDWAENIANALDSIPWDTIQAAAYNTGQHFAELLNGVFANLHLAESLGTTIAEALNTGLSFALGFLETFDFSQFGIWVGTLWNAIINAFDFDKLASVISLGGNGVIDALTYFFLTIMDTCETLGQGFAKIFNSVFVDIDFSRLANAILLGVHDVNLALEGFNSDVKWGEAAQNIIGGINKLIQGTVLDKDGKLTNVWAENGTQIGTLIGGFVHSVYEIVSGLDYVTLGENIGLWFKNAANEIDFGEVLGIITEGIKGLASAVVSFCGTVDFYELGAEIGGKLEELFQDESFWHTIGEALGSALQSAFDFVKGIVDQIGIEDVIAAIESFLEGFCEGFEDWGSLAKLILTLIAEKLISKASDFAKLKFVARAIFGGIGGGATESAAEPAARGILASLKGAISGAGTSLKGVASSIISGIGGAYTSLGGIGGILTTDLSTIAGAGTATEIGLTVGTGLVGGITAAVGGWKLGSWISEELLGVETQPFLDTMQDIKDSFSDGSWKGALQLWGSDIQSGVSTAWENVKTSASTAWENVKTNTSTAWESVKSTVSTSAENVKTSASTAWENVKTNTSTAWESVKSTVSTSAENVKTSASTAWENVKTNTSTAWESVKSTVSTSAENTKTSATNAWNDLKTNTSTAYNNIKTTIKNQFNQAKSSVSSSVAAMKSSAQTGWQNMSSNAKTQFQSILSTTKSKMSEATNHLKGIEWGSIGTNLVSGLLGGIKSTWNSLTSWVSGAASSLTSKMKSTFGIASPSKVWAQIGVFLDEGLMEGLDSKKKSLLSSVSGLAEGVTERMGTADGSISIADGEDISRLDAVLARLNQISDVINGITRALASMGGLQIPQIATGSVVPYKTRIAADTEGESYTEDSSHLAEISRMMQSILEYMQQNSGGGQNRDIKVIIDGREVLRAVVDENERAIQRTGMSPIRV